jgi:type I restriction enzyme M protein
MAMTTPERDLELSLVTKLQDRKYENRPDIRDRITLEANFREKFQKNYLSDEQIENIINTYQQRPEKIERYARRVEMSEIEAHGFNLNISRYVSTANEELTIDLSATHKRLRKIDKQIKATSAKHNVFLKELGLSPLPGEPVP